MVDRRPVFALALTLLTASAARAQPVRGTVADESGRPLAGAQVELARYPSHFERARLFLAGRAEPEPETRATTGEDGSYSLVAPAPGMYALTVRAEGRVPLQSGVLAITEPMTLPPASLPADVGCRLELRGPGGPLEGAWVLAVPAAGQSFPEGWQEAPRLMRSGPTGIVSLPRTRPERLDLHFFHPEHGWLAELRGVREQARVSMPALTAPRHSLLVRDPRGAPIAGALVALGKLGWPLGTTGADGRLDIARSPAADPIHLLHPDGRRLEAPLTGTSITLPDSSPLVGTVRSDADEQRPVAGALVWRAADPGAAAVSDEHGRFTLAAPEPDGLVRARAAGFLPASVVGPERARDLRLEPSRPAFGRVVDGGEQPVAGALVKLTPARQPAAATPLYAQTDARGRFEISHLPAEIFDLLAWHRGFAPTAVRAIATPPGLAPFDLGTVFLENAAILTGRVSDGEGHPVAGVAVWLSDQVHRPADDLLGLEPRKAPDATTDADGRFKLEDLRSGERFHLLLRREGFLPAVVAAVRTPATSPLAVVLRPGLGVRGRVVDVEDRPIAGAEIALTPAFRAGSFEMPLIGREHAKTATSGADGSFALAAVALGRYRVSARAEGFLAAEPREIEIAPESEALILVLGQGAILAGKATTIEGRPVAGARILAGETSAVSDAEGFYRVVGVTPGQLALEARHPIYRRIEREVTISLETENVLDLVFEGGVAVAGRVIDEAGEPIAGAVVEIEGGDPEERHRQHTFSGEDGRFVFAEVAAGGYQLGGEKSGRAAARLTQEIIVATEPIEDLELVLPAGVRLRGQISGLDFEQLAGVEVVAEQLGRPSLRGEVDYAGAYTIADLDAGEWLVRAETRDRRKEARALVSVEPAAGEIEQDLEFGRGLRLTGRVFFAGEPLGSARISLVGHDVAARREALCDHEGAFVLEDLEPGSYRLAAAHPRELLVKNVDVFLGDDQELTLEIQAARIHGAVTAAGGGPLAAAKVLLYQLLENGSEASLYGTVTNAEGVFTVPRLAAGSYRMAVAHDGYQAVEEHLELPPGADDGPRRYELQPAQPLRADDRAAAPGL